MLGISIKSTLGIGDQLQFSSLPENYYAATGEKMLDLSRPWFFDHNPYLVRDAKIVPTRKIEMWNFSPPQYPWPTPHGKAGVYLSNAEIWASVLNLPTVLNRPRLYKYEDFPYEKRRLILLHVSGRSHGLMPLHIIEHVKKKYMRSGNLWLVGPPPLPGELDYGIPRLVTTTLWEFAQLASEARMLIGMDSGPSWIAACYPDVVVKKVRTTPNPPEEFEHWVPLEVRNIHSHWDSREHGVYNISEKDIGFTWSYLRI